MRVLGVVTARGGSKGVPRKNIRLLGGKPLLAWTVENARNAKRLDRLVLSTDDPDIAAVGRDAGIEVPFVRPAELARDTSPTLPVLQHAVTTLEDQGDRFDVVCLLQPTNPLRTARMIDDAIERFASTSADSLITVLPVPADYNPHWVYFRDDGGSLRLATGEPTPIPRRQDLPAAYHRDGSVYLVKRDVLMLGASLFGTVVAGLEVDPSESINIDTLEDWTRAEAMIQGAR